MNRAKLRISTPYGFLRQKFADKVMRRQKDRKLVIDAGLVYPALPTCDCERLADGGVAERLKAHAWKVCIRETVSRVRIPLPPPFINVFKHLGGSIDRGALVRLHRVSDEGPGFGAAIPHQRMN
jgi:hypothetical protein